MSELDAFDVKILALLQSQGDLSQIELSERVHLSASQCARRIARLKQDQFIARFVAVLNPQKLGLTIWAHSHVSLRLHEDAANQKFRRFIKLRPEVTECYAQTGEADYFLKICVRDLIALNEILNDIIAATGGVAALRTSIVLEEIKRTTELSLGAA